MYNIIIFIVVMFIIVVLGGGVGFILYIKSRPKKRTFKANVYRLSDGVTESIKDKHGNIISDIKLNELLPYKKDIIQRSLIRGGVVLYKLVRLDIVCPEVLPHHIDKWGEEEEVNCLIDGETVVMLSKGYDTKTSKAIFKPIPTDRLNLLKSEIIDRSNRLIQEKDTLAAITPWVIAGICMLGLVAMVYLNGTAFVQTSNNIEEGNKYAANKQLEIAKLYKEMYSDSIITNQEKQIGEQPKEKTPPPVE